MLLHKVDEQHWPLLTAMRVKNFHPLDTPVPPQTPEHLRNQIHWYASDLFKTEADQYEQFRSDVRYGAWLSNLADRTRTRVMKALEKLESSDPLAKMIGVTGSRGLILGYHGLTTQGVEEELRIMLLELRGQYERGTSPQPASPKIKPASPPPAATPQQPQPIKAEKPRRMPTSVHSPSAAAKMTKFMDSKGLGQTEFAIQANTTDKTIRKFRQTGTIKRSILADIAKAMGTTKEDLLS
jgi:hypothetical protein